MLCADCGGVWLSRTLVTKMAASDCLVALRAIAEDAARRAPFGGSLGRTAVPCAYCAAPMQRFLRGQLVLDVCSEHGTWFDRGELPRFVEQLAASAGGPFRSAQLQEPLLAVPLPAEPLPPGPGPAPADQGRLAEMVGDLLEFLLTG